jgi:hypothetical protein
MSHAMQQAVCVPSDANKVIGESIVIILVRVNASMTHAIRRMGRAVTAVSKIFLTTCVTVQRIAFALSQGSVMIVTIIHFMGHYVALYVAETV